MFKCFMSRTGGGGASFWDQRLCKHCPGKLYSARQTLLKKGANNLKGSLFHRRGGGGGG